uniref:tRNA(Phe) (4-demethylwyosine(37)-C(7)) aminocarboxypropyltransferase n=1 Tax=Attheya septentrionalis TaxID=420275 RepID=A0A7S2XQ02_9STRA|mmetsp:Transcript_1956/g.3515  ORF Transcript_1956/g.3515 Transcript_1956/m.3515 type:complete len:408 (+) Transcript_1956:210-1433(+)|eukprot:CAMPEP_0198302902 /NCGR_PEP_ID=MMETSP1449-20131203/56609_1 /TAXON_ID=420275 /ORGANISM="Attheya septentrionalis, Strain CCMP2084" /LENGTH=407 /DNA_ID=CAMNT_0044005381 /DNA_START=210 /DNA_END=1433 /DNA_ORIENTATION=-
MNSFAMKSSVKKNTQGSWAIPAVVLVVCFTVLNVRNWVSVLAVKTDAAVKDSTMELVLEAIKKTAASSSALKDEISSMKGALEALKTLSTGSHSEADTLQSSVFVFPLSLKSLGDALIGPTNMARAIAEAHEVILLNVLSEKVLLTSHKDDDSIPRLKWEFSDGGGYKFSEEIKSGSSTPPLVLDVGGNLGFTSIAMAKFHKDAQIIIFEPNPYTYIYLRWNIYLNNIHVLTTEELELRPSLPGIYPVFGGLAGGDKPFVMTSMPAGFPEKSQTHKPQYEESVDGGVPIYSLSHFMKSHDLMERGIDIVKIDCECCEYVLIPTNKDFFASRTHVKSLIGELHPFARCGPFLKLPDTAQTELVETLEKRGCPLSPEDYDDNHYIGYPNFEKITKPPKPCCPVLCANQK